MRLILTGTSLLALAACASSEAPATTVVAAAAAPAVASAASAVPCHRETITGSSMSHKVCGETSDADRQGSIDGIHKMAGTGAGAAGGGFGH